MRLSDLCDVSAYTVLILVLASIPLTMSRRRELVFVWLTLAVWTATHVVFFGEPRYRLPLLPILLTFAAVSLVQLIDLAQRALSPAAEPVTPANAPRQQPPRKRPRRAV